MLTKNCSKVILFYLFSWNHESIFNWIIGDFVGGDAYHCEKCNKKVSTVNRMCTSCIGTAGAKRYKFEDGDVSECKMEDDEEMKNQCFGGEYMGEVFGHVVKRSYRRRKRWWNAYILFYTKEDIDVSNRMSDLTINEPVLSPSPFSLSLAIKRSVRKQNKVPSHVQPVFGGILPIHEETYWLSYTVPFGWLENTFGQESLVTAEPRSCWHWGAGSFVRHAHPSSTSTHSSENYQATWHYPYNLIFSSNVLNG